jgi:hypothetical protein
MKENEDSSCRILPERIIYAANSWPRRVDSAEEACCLSRLDVSGRDTCTNQPHEFVRHAGSKRTENLSNIEREVLTSTISYHLDNSP